MDHTALTPDAPVGAAIKTLAITQIVLGILALAAGTAATVIFPVFLCRGLLLIWPEFVFLVSGILGIYAVKKKSDKLIYSHMVLSLISIMSGFILIFESVVGLGVSTGLDFWFQFMFYAMLALAALDMGVNIASSVYSCRVVCCCAEMQTMKTRRADDTHQAVVTFQNGQLMNAQGQVVVQPNQIPTHFVYVNESSKEACHTQGKGSAVIQVTNNNVKNP